MEKILKKRILLPGRMLLPTLMFFTVSALFIVPVAAQVVDPPPVVSAVVITAPVKAGETPWRTNNQTVGLTFTAVIANGQFVANSAGGDIPFSSFIGQTGTGTVAVGLNTEGIHNVQVILSSVSSGGTYPSVSSASASVSIIYDATAPVLNVTQIKVNELQGWVPYNAGQPYYSNASEIGLRGTVIDQYTPSEEIVVKVTGMVTGEVQAESNGQFEIVLGTGHLADGLINIDLIAIETMSDGTFSSPSDSFRVSLSGD